MIFVKKLDLARRQIMKQALLNQIRLKLEHSIFSPKISAYSIKGLKLLFLILPWMIGLFSNTVLL